MLDINKVKVDLEEVIDELLDDIKEGQRRDKYIADKMAYVSKLLGIYTTICRSESGIDPV